jgi:DNA repair exonuclease SbcCD ATPase subunit
MIPRRIRIQGFLSYDSMEEPISFDGARLWMLSGANGAGKSSIFDAMTFALYGHHRAGKARNYGGLLHKGADRLAVEFEFTSGGRDYRILRTRTRAGNPGFQAWERIDGSWKTVERTQTEDGLLAWVSSPDVIGMKADAFLSSVLLRQGEADRLLKAEREERFSVLSQIIDLSRYRRLYQLADARRLERERDERRLQRERDAEATKLAALAADAAAEVTALQERETNAEHRRDDARARLEKLLEWKSQAAAWEKLRAEEAGLREAERQAQELLARAERIERDGARLASLAAGLPRMTALLDARRELKRQRGELGRSAETAEGVRQRVALAGALCSEAQTAVEALDREHRKLLEQENAASQEVQQLAPAIEELRQRDRDAEEVERLERELRGYPPDLDERCAALEAEVDSLTSLQVALPLLQRFARQRAEWGRAREQAAKAADAAARATQRRAAMADAQARQAKVFESRRAKAEEASEAMHAADARLCEVRERIARFERTKDAPLCRYCGQDLPAAHRARHEEELREEQAAAEVAHQGARAMMTDAAAAQKTAEAELKRLDEEERAETQATGNAEAAAREWELRAENAHEAAKNAREGLPHTYARAVEPHPGATLEECLAQPYPEDQDLETLQRDAAALSPRPTELAAMRETARLRDALVLQQALSKQRRDAPREHLRVRMPEEIRSRHEAAVRKQRETQKARTGLEPRFEAARRELQKAESALIAATQEVSVVDAILQQVTRAVAKAERAVAAREAALSPEWQPDAARLTAQQIRDWEDELCALAGADERVKELNQARVEADRRKHRLPEVERDLEETPVQARRPATDIEDEERQAREEARAAEADREKAKSRREQIERLRDQVAAKERERLEAAREMLLCRKLAALLDDRSGLQRDLLRRAVHGVVAAANDVLDRLSAARLRIDLKEDGDALDVVATRQGESGDPHDVDFLSGSERFRIAVSLALGIGRYASLSGQRVSCAIIDEGFGCLDEDGRHEMIDALQDLKDHLEMIIVVSHQREFYDRFPNRYEISRENGASQVRLAMQD